MQVRLSGAVLLHPVGEPREDVDVGYGDGSIDVAVHLLAPDTASFGDLALATVRMRLQVGQRRVADVEHVGSKNGV